MNETLDFLVRHGAMVMFVALFIEQVGLPFPATPFLLYAGALVGAGKLNTITTVGAAVTGSLVADMIWFYVGIFTGKRALKLVCRVSLEPDSCVRRTEDLFARFGMRGLIAGKFIPGLSTLLPPLAGSSGISVRRFLFFDGISSVVYCGSFLLVGFLFSNQVEQIVVAFAGLGSGTLALLVAFLAAYITYKYVQRRRVLRESSVARITVDELRHQQETGENPLVLDLRPASEIDHAPYLIPGALQINIDDVARWQHEIPRDRDIILYCSCPDEGSSAKIARRLQRSGFTRVRPLLGGIEAWRERQYPVELRRSPEIRPVIAI